MTSCCDILKVRILLQTMSVKSLADSRFPEGLIVAVFDGCVGFSPQRPSPKRRGVGERVPYSIRRHYVEKCN
jgi:hypothetical protein